MSERTEVKPIPVKAPFRQSFGNWCRVVVAPIVLGVMDEKWTCARELTAKVGTHAWAIRSALKELAHQGKVEQAGGGRGQSQGGEYDPVLYRRAKDVGPRLRQRNPIGRGAKALLAQKLADYRLQQKGTGCG